MAASDQAKSQPTQQQQQSLASHGRGGAGNMAGTASSPRLQPSDLHTPTLKSSVVTTGRGGTGNMAKNKDPKETRQLQDVEGYDIPRKQTATPVHAGRGGAGNIYTENEDKDKKRENGAEVAPSSADKKKQQQQSEKKPNGNGETLAPAVNHAVEQTEEVADKAKKWFFGKKA